MAELKARVLVVEGPIGAGKSTLVEVLANVLRAKGEKVCVVQEPVPLWEEIGIVKAFYADPKKHALAFQICTFTTRIKAVNDAVVAHPEATVFILERSILTDNIFAELQRKSIGELHMVIYQQFYEQYIKLMPLDLSKATYIFLKPTLVECMKRVAARSREGEIVEAKHIETEVLAAGGVSEEYQDLLIKAHEAYFEGAYPDLFTTLKPPPFPRTNVVVVDGELAAANFKTVDADRVGTILVDRLGFI